MKMTATITSLTLLLVAVPLWAQSEELTPPTTSSSETPSISTLTPEMWFYLQELKRHDDPAQAVRRKAEFRAEQRRQRLAMRKWYGHSQSRPHSSATPWTNDTRPRFWSRYGHTNHWRANLSPYATIEPRPGSLWR
ncbi:MAG: hypothetical protein MK179_02810 [Pirellulaceae bacterium]|nr:hypothetical protein [Pirellulaceae bacterium]